MIAGAVTVDREAVVPLKVRGPSGREEDVEAIIDTGFDGWLSLPPSMIAGLGLAWRRRGKALLADGSESVLDIHEGHVWWDGQLVRIAVDAAEMVPLIGNALLDGFRLPIEVRDGGLVAIEPLP